MNGGCLFQKLAQVGAAPVVHLERAREWVRLRTCHPPALSNAQDQKLTGILIGAMPDHGPQPGWTSPAL
jgi:hypothetical protein